MNPVVSFVEDAVSGTLAVLAILLPVLAFASVLLVTVWTARRLAQFFRRNRQAPSAPLA
jgi:hypothetical protein